MSWQNCAIPAQHQFILINFPACWILPEGADPALKLPFKWSSPLPCPCICSVGCACQQSRWVSGLILFHSLFPFRVELRAFLLTTPDIYQRTSTAIHSSGNDAETFVASHQKPGRRCCPALRGLYNISERAGHPEYFHWKGGKPAHLAARPAA